MDEKSKPKLIKIIIQLLILFAVLVVLLFLPAGTLDWLQAWLLILFLMIYFILYIYFGIYKNPEQTRERSKIAPNVKRWDKVIMSIYTALLPTVFILAGLDVGRFELSVVPIIIQIIAWAGLVFAGAVIMWTVISNTYLSRYARIQDDRGQEVVITGPYKYIRHPMYLGILILFLCIGPALGSILALVPGSMIAILFIARTAKEDEMLCEELDGYKDYTKQVRYRLVPGVW
jgi:protein-S-isoprenylcysteine O-methyltransferase Ste14